MKRIRNLPRLRKRLGYLEKKALEKRAKKDKGKELVTMSYGDINCKLPSFVIHEITKFELIRDFIFDNYKIILDCKGIDKQIVNCSKVDTCSKQSCKHCICVFSEVISKIDCLVHNASASLKLFDAKKINKRNNLIVKIAQTDSVSEKNVKVMLRTKLDIIAADIHKEEIETKSLIVGLLNEKIRFIDTIEQTIRLYLDYYLNRISYYLENIPSPRSSDQFISLNRILDICDSSILAFYDGYRKDANNQIKIYDEEGEALHKTPLALAIARSEYAIRGVLIDTDAANVDYKRQWVTKREWEEVITAIAIARDAMSIVNTGQEVNDEVEALDSAVTMFNSAKKDGSFVDTTMLVDAINIAEVERKNVIISDNSDKVHYKSVWVTHSELEQFNDSIEKAQISVKVVHNEDQVVSATNSLTNAIAVFIKNKKNGTYVDKSALEAVIVKAEKEIENVEISTTAINVDYKRKWVYQDQWESFVSAIATAKKGLSAASTDDEVLETTNALARAIKDFINTKKNGNYVNKDALKAIIERATSEIENISISTTSLDIDYKKWWVTQKEYDILRNVLKNATQSYKNATTDEQILDATNKLREYVIDFTKQKKKGEFIDKSLLEKSIKNAEDAKNNIIIDIDGNSVDSKRVWVTAKEYNDLDEAIMFAKNRLSMVRTDEEVFKDSNSLNAATTAFNNCKKKGTFVDKSILSKEILKAENSMAGVLVGTNSADINYKSDWVTQKVWDILTNSIVSAQKSMKSVLTEKQVKNVAKRMRKAIDGFEKSKQKGTFVDTTMLSAAIKKAEAKLENISVDEVGDNVMSDCLWVTKEEWKVFNLAIEEARNAIYTVKDDEQVVEAAEMLTLAIDTFDSVLKNGIMSEPKTDNTLVQEINNVESE